MDQFRYERASEDGRYRALSAACRPIRFSNEAVGYANPGGDGRRIPLQRHRMGPADNVRRRLQRVAAGILHFEIVLTGQVTPDVTQGSSTRAHQGAKGVRRATVFAKGCGGAYNSHAGSLRRAIGRSCRAQWKNPSVTVGLGSDHHVVAAFATFSRHGGVGHYGANEQGRSDETFAAVLVP